MSDFAVNDKGDAVYYDGKAWQPATVAVNNAGDKVAYDGKEWRPLGGKQAVALYSPNPDAPKSYGGEPGSYQEGERTGPVHSEFYDAAPDAGKMYDKFARAVTDRTVRGLTFVPDLAIGAARAAGMMPPGENLGDIGHRALFGDNNPEPEPANKWEGLATDLGNATGDVASTYLTGKAAGVPFKGRAPSLPANVPRYASAPTDPIGKIIADALSSQPGAQLGITAAGNVAGTASGDPNVGAAITAGLPIVAGGGQRVFQAAPAETTQEVERRALMDWGRQNGMGPLTFGKIMNSPGLQKLESAAVNLPIPFVGGGVSKIENEARNAFQAKALEKTGTFGETAATPGVKEAIADRIGASFDALENNSTIHIDPQFGQDIADAKMDFSKQLQVQMPIKIRKQLDELETASTALNQPGAQTVSIDGATYKNIRSKLSAMLPVVGGTDKEAVGAMIDALDGAVERSLPADQVQDWKDVRQQWRNYLALDKATAANNAQTAQGNISTAAFGRAARDNPDLERLAQYGSMFIGDKAPNTSGTASHNIASTMLSGAGIISAYEGLQHLGLDPVHAGLAVLSLGAPAAIERALNNPVTRSAFLARYRNAAPSIAKPSLIGSSAFNAEKEEQ